MQRHSSPSVSFINIWAPGPLTFPPKLLPSGSPLPGMGGLFGSEKNLGFREGSSCCLMHKMQGNREEGEMGVGAT